LERILHALTISDLSWSTISMSPLKTHKPNTPWKTVDL
jgi:hypothetical protein